MARVEMHEREDGGLRDGWVWTTLGEIAVLVGGGTPSRAVAKYFAGDIVWLTPTEIPKDRVAVLTDSKERITKEGLRDSSARLLPKGTVLMTSRASIGYVAIAGDEVTTNQGFASFTCAEGIYNLYLAYWLWANGGMFVQSATGTTFKEISKAALRTFAFPLAPLSEQQRIVAEIEKQLTRLDAGVAALKRAQVALRRYRASVLKAACEGKLVPQGPSDEPADQLLRRILNERRAKWEADLRAKGKDPTKAKYEEPVGPATAGLGELPEGWEWASLSQLLEAPLTNGRSVKDYPGGFPVLRLNALRKGNVDLTQRKAGAWTREEAEAYLVHAHDFLVARGNGSLDLVGQGGLVREGPGDVAFPDTMIRVRVNNTYAKRSLSVEQGRLS